MSEKIEPALTAEEWQRQSFERDTPERETVTLREKDGTPFEAAVYGQRAELDGNMLTISDTEWGPRAIPALIALANAALPDADPRKITRKMVTGLRETALEQPWNEGLGLWLNQIADALESYLPPVA